MQNEIWLWRELDRLDPVLAGRTVTRPLPLEEIGAWNVRPVLLGMVSPERRKAVERFLDAFPKMFSLAPRQNFFYRLFVGGHVVAVQQVRYDAERLPGEGALAVLYAAT